MSPPLPVVSGAEAVAALRRLGFTQVSQRGSHVKMRNAERVAIIPLHRELASGTLRSILRQAGVTVDDFAGVLEAATTATSRDRGGVSASTC